MWRVLLSKVVYGVVVIFLVATLVSSIIYLAPVDPARLTFGQRSDNATVLAKQKELGLDQPLSTQLMYYLRDISPIVWVDRSTWMEKYENQGFTLFSNQKMGTLGIKTPYLRESYQSGRAVSSMLSETIPRTVILATSAFLLATILGIMLGVFSAVKKGTRWDDSIIFFSTLGYSVPSYVSAMILALVFGYMWHEYTGLNIQGGIVELNEIGDEVIVCKNLILPAIALGIRPLAVVTQLTRSTMLDEFTAPYIRTARAKGLSKYKVIFGHALRNALNPVVTSLSSWFAALLAGAFFVENVFSYKGLGQMTVQALINYDIPVLLGAILFTSVVFVTINIIVDILYTYIDPRLRLT